MFVTVSNRASHALAISVSSLALVIGTSAFAQTWDGSESSDIFVDANWIGGVQPPLGGDAIITGPADHMPVLDGVTANLDTLFAGHEDGVTLDMVNGASLTTRSASIGEKSVNNAGNLLELQSATGTMSGASTWTTSALNIGFYGTGIVNVTGASTLNATTSITLGQHRNGTTMRFGSGTLNISGAGSHVTSSGVTVIGASGVGVIDISAGGRLTTGSTVLGQNALGEGTVNITGAGSRWGVSSAVTTTIGQGGTGAVNVTNGGAFASPGWVVLGNGGGSGELAVSGQGTEFHAGQIRVGGSGPGTHGTGTFAVSAGALVEATHLLVGNADSGTGTVTISGDGTSVAASTYAMVGWNGVGSLTLSEAAALETPLVLLGYGGGSQGTFNIGAAAGDAAKAGGALDAAEVRFGAGTGTLVFNHTDTGLNFAPKVTGNGTIRQLAGVTNFLGDSSAFAGNTLIEGGTLKAMGTLGGTLSVNSNGTLGGSGTVGATAINSGGTLSPDGTLSVNGNLSFADGATYHVNVGDGTSDLVAATGTASLDGKVKVQPGGRMKWDESHKVLSAATLAGTFDSITTTSAFIDATLDYSTANEVWINLIRNDVNFEDVATNSNQRSLGQVITNMPVDNPLVIALASLSAEEAREVMDQISGDTHSTLSTTGMAVSGQVQGVVMNRIRQAFTSLGLGTGNVSSYLPGTYNAGGMETSPPFTVWLQGLGEYNHVAATGSAGGLDAGTGGIIGGVDTPIDDWRIGATAGYTATRFAATGRNAEGTVQNLHAGIYAGADFDPIRVQFNALQTWHGISSKRSIDVGGLTETLSADYGAATSLLFGEVGYEFDLGAVELEPFGSLSYAISNTGAYTETGGNAALSSGAAHNQALSTVIGARASASMAVDDKLLTATGMLGWQHHIGQAPTTQFTLAGSQPFSVTGASPASDALVYEAGINLDLSESLNFDLLYSGRSAFKDVSHSIRAVVAASF